MTKRDKWVIAIFIILALLFLFSIPVKIAYPQEAHIGTPVVFHVTKEDAPGRYAVEPVEVILQYKIKPIDGTHPAPLEANSLVVCRPFSEGMKYFLRCGTDLYSVTAIALQSKGDKQ